MAFVQANEIKLRLVMNFRELNCFVYAFTANPVYVHRSYGNVGKDVAILNAVAYDVVILDLTWAYPQVHLQKSLRPYQVVMIQSQI